MSLVYNFYAEKLNYVLDYFEFEYQAHIVDMRQFDIMSIHYVPPEERSW